MGGDNLWADIRVVVKHAYHIICIFKDFLLTFVARGENIKIKEQFLYNYKFYTPAQGHKLYAVCKKASPKIEGKMEYKYQIRQHFLSTFFVRKSNKQLLWSKI